MQTVEIPPRLWPQTFDAFSAAHEGWLISIDVLAADLGAQPEVCDLALVGIVAESPDSGGTITVSVVGPSGAEQTTHTVHAPTRVQIERTDEGADVAMQIESAEQTTTIVRLRTPAMPETVDGIVKP
jgi:hypothetical protein